MTTTTMPKATKINAGVYEYGAYLLRHERDNAGTLRWFAYGDGPSQPFASADTLKQLVAQLAD